jgi:serine/threonine protein kinase
VNSQMISHYRILSKLGAGGMGEVYLAEDTKLERKVAIKCLPQKSRADEKAKMRLVREAQVAAKLDHPNICTIYEHLEQDNQSFIVMQYIEGEPLSAKLRRKRFALRESLDVVLQVAEALAEAHSHGIIHRDIKPQNIIVTPRGQVKVLDFGLAKILQLGQTAMREAKTQLLLTQAGTALGTVRYMSPEQARGLPVDGRSDLFCLGTLLYECLAGRPAFTGATSLEIGAQVIYVDPPPPSLFSPVPAELDRITLKALAKKPEARHQSAGELIRDLHDARGMLSAEHRTLVPWISERISRLPSRFTATAWRSFWRSGDFARSTVAQLALAMLFWWLLSQTGGVVPHPPTAKVHRASIEAVRAGTAYPMGEGTERVIKPYDDLAR